jgi:putative PEP-CTERM system histidine kinase
VLAADWSEDGSRAGDMAALDARSEFIQFIERRHWIIDLPELKATPERYQNLRLPDSLAAAKGLTLIVPLMHADKLVGLLGLGPPDGPFEMSYEDRDLLKTVGRHIGTHLAQLEADRRLSENQQFEAYSRLTAFMMHDLKNLVAQLSLVVANADKHRRNPEFVDDTIDTVRNSTDRMTRLIEQLQRGDVRSLDREVSLEETLTRVIGRIRERGVIPSLECAGEPIVVLADPERLAMTVEHVVRNAQDATGSDGAVSVRVVRDGARAVIQVADTGVGMTAEFIRDRLFRPFDSTKGTKGMGIGVYQVRDYVRSLNGEVSVTSAPGAGTVFCIALPVANPRKER